jgi:outer membrane lipopolysaccharide assembly protein LptE/RlpB
MKPMGLVCAAAFLCAGCGYHLAGRSDVIPKTAKTIAIPAFSNATTRYKLTERLPTALTREFLARTKYRVVTDQNQADILLQGSVNNYMSYPVVFDPTTGRAAGLQVSVFVSVRLVERASGKVLFTRDNLELRERYEVSIDQRAYFDESETAMDRIGTALARSLVSAILEAF